MLLGRSELVPESVGSLGSLISTTFSVRKVSGADDM